MHWEPFTLHHPDTGEEVHGGGIQYSFLLRAAKASLQVQGGRVALFNINWDGGLIGFGARSCTPIHVQVMNTNSTSAIAVGLIGYLPYLDVPKGYADEDNYKAASHHVLQTCIGKIVACIEARAGHGFRCTIGGETMLLFPRIGVMSLDTPERVKFFGLRSQASCPICRRRNGRSAARTCTFHCPQEVKRMFDIACAPNEETVGRAPKRRRKHARDRLLRHGLNYEKRCRITDNANITLVHIPQIGPRLFAGLARYERMHVYFIGYCGYLMELLIQCVKKNKYAQVKQIVKQCHQFRDPATGITHPRLPHLMKMTHLTAERRVRAIFYWAHVLGTSADVVHEECLRAPAQRAVATLQIILIAVRGHRAYTSDELDVIFKGVSTQFFSALEELAHFHYTTKYNNKRRRYNNNPAKYAEPRLFRKTNRSGRGGG